MKKILIIGELEYTEKILSDYLSEEYQVQLCAKQLEMIQTMVGILKPDLVILSNLEPEKDQKTLNWFQEKHSKLPVLIVLSSEDQQTGKGLFKKPQFEKLTSPFTKNSLQTKCTQILSKNNPGKNTSIMKKILVVDDTPIMLRDLKKMLENTYDVVLASSGRQALQTILKEEPDLVLLDYEMPEMDGREVFETMLADKDMKNIPVVFLTSVSDREAVFSILQSKPADYILKPVNQDRLFNTIKNVLKK